MTQKPYISKVGHKWVVIDKNGKDHLETRDYKKADTALRVLFGTTPIIKKP